MTPPRWEDQILRNLCVDSAKMSSTDSETFDLIFDCSLTTSVHQLENRCVDLQSTVEELYAGNKNLANYAKIKKLSIDSLSGGGQRDNAYASENVVSFYSKHIMFVLPLLLMQKNRNLEVIQITIFLFLFSRLFFSRHQSFVCVNFFVQICSKNTQHCGEAPVISPNILTHFSQRKDFL